VRALVDAVISARMAFFFAAKTRAAHEFALHELDGRPGAAARAVRHYDEALAQWDLLCEVADVYTEDQSFGQAAYTRGHWRDRRPAIAADLARLRAQVGDAEPSDEDGTAAAAPAAPEVEITADGARVRVRTGSDVDSVTLFHRPLDQAAAWSTRPMESVGGSSWEASLPAEAEYPTQYFVEVIGAGGARRLPRYDPTISQVPYLVVEV
jgi:hypothetical protein